MTNRVLQLLGPSSGGIRRHVATLDAALPSAGWRSAVAGPAHVMDGLGVEAEVVEVPDGVDPVGLWRAVRSLRRHRDQFDVLHAHGLKAGWVAALARLDQPMVLTVHNLVLGEVAGRAAPVLGRLEGWVGRRADRLVGVSPEIVERFEGIVPPERRSFIVPASPPPVPARARREVRADLGVPDDVVLIAVVARLHPQKDLPTFVAAFARVVEVHPTCRAIIVGDGPLADELRRLVDEVGLGSSLQLTGASAHAVDEMAAADVVALSSRWEGAPLVVAEALQLGKPVISTRVGVVPEMVGDAGIITEVGDVDALAAALIDVVGDAGRRTTMGEIGRHRGAAIYGVEPLVERIAQLYTEVVNQ